MEGANALPALVELGFESSSSEPQSRALHPGPALSFRRFPSISSSKAASLQDSALSLWGNIGQMRSISASSWLIVSRFLVSAPAIVLTVLPLVPSAN